MGEAESCGESVSQESCTFFVNVIGEFVKCEVGFSGKVSEAANGGV